MTHGDVGAACATGIAMTCPTDLRRSDRARHRAALVTTVVVTAMTTLWFVTGSPVTSASAESVLPVGDRAGFLGGETSEARYRPPVDAPVVDGFRIDDGPYGAGNRGLEYGTTGGETVVATADGKVTFVGMVAGRLVVTLAHPDGRLSSLTYMESVVVVVGDPVTAGVVIGTAGVGLHFGVREDGRYLDPAVLFDRPYASGRRGVAHLVEP